MLTSKQRAFLRSKAAFLDCIFQVGKGGVSENMLKSIEDALTAKELIKLKCLENCEYTAREACDGIAEALGADGVQVIGNKFVLFRISPENRKYDLDKLCEIGQKEEKKTSGKGGNAPKKKRKPANGSENDAKSRVRRPSYTVTRKGAK